MPYEDEESPYVEPDKALDALAFLVIGAAIEVHRHLGAGLDEALYREAMVIELGLQGCSVERELVCEVSYKGQAIGRRRVDLLVDNRLVFELKTVDKLAPVHTAQVLTYLKITDRKLGLLINFKEVLLKDGIKRVINPTGRELLASWRLGGPTA